MEYKLHNGSGGLCCKGCSRQDKQLNTYDWLADIPGNAEESDMVEVQFKNTRKGYYRNSNKIKLEKGDVVAVEAAPGHDIGVVTLTGRLVPLQMKKANFKADTEIKTHLSESQTGGYGKVQRGEKQGTWHYDPCTPDCVKSQSEHENRRCRVPGRRQ